MSFLGRIFRSNQRLSDDSRCQLFDEHLRSGKPSLHDDAHFHIEHDDDFVVVNLKWARAFALDRQIPIGRHFGFTIEDVPSWVSGDNELAIALRARTRQFGLVLSALQGNHAVFLRVS